MPSEFKLFEKGDILGAVSISGLRMGIKDLEHIRKFISFETWT